MARPATAAVLTAGLSLRAGQAPHIQSCGSKRKKGMSDNPKDRGPQDRSRINVNEDYEVRYWTKELGVSEERLRQLVKDHGVSAEAIRSAIGSK